MNEIGYKAALVTGAAKRIGREIALGLAAQGIFVVVHHHASEDSALEVVATIKANGGMAATACADLEQTDTLGSLVSEAAETAGCPIDVLVNNASVFEEDTLESLSTNSWQKHQKVNLEAPVLLTHALAKQLPPDSEGLIINIIDQRVLKLNPKFMSYTASKAGLWTMTRTTAQALAPAKIRVNAIAPGPTLPNQSEGDAGFQQEIDNVPLARGPQLQEISRAVTFLLEAPSLTGQMLTLDGGQHLAWQTPDIP